MRLSQLRIQNFRSFEDEIINFNDYNCFVGPNGSGKSTVLNALNILFRNTQAASNVISLDEEDFHHSNTKKPIIITATFIDLSESAMKDLKAYVRQNKLIFSAKAVWNPDTRRAEVTQIGSRQVIKDFAKYFRVEKEGGKATELKTIFKKLREKYPEIEAASAKTAMQQALRDYEEAHPELCEPVPSSDQFYGWSKGVNLLENHCQWVYVPAVKDPTEEQQEGKNTALGTLLHRTIRSQVDFKDSLDALRREAGQKYQEIIREKQDALKDIGRTIQDRLRDWSHPGARVDLLWHYDDTKSVSVTDPIAAVKIGEGEFVSDMVRLGHGMQRSFIVALLQLLSSTREGAQPTLILGFEEPELYQHPPQARHLSSVLEKLSTGNAQVMITTHSPYFISARGFENVRMTRAYGQPSKTVVTDLTYEKLSESLSTALGTDPPQPSTIMAAVEQIMQPSQNELFFSKVPILVEGSEDIAFLSTHLHLNKKWEEFRRYGCHFIVCSGKNKMSRPLAIAKGLGIPAFVLFDGDCDKATGADRANHERDNKCLMKLCSIEKEPITEKSYFSESMVMWCKRIQDEIKNDIGNENWEKAEAEARNKHSLNDGVRQKNPMVISATIELLWEKGMKSSLLDRLCSCILEHAKRVAAE